MNISKLNGRESFRFNFKAKRDKNFFDTETFSTFVNVLKSISDTICANNEIPIKFQYLGVHYTKLIFRYKKDVNNMPIGVLFSLPHPTNQHMSCTVVGGGRTAIEAMRSIQNFINGKYA